MLKLIEGSYASFFPREIDAMFRNRAQTFSERLGWAYTDKDYNRDRNLVPDIAALQRNVDLTRDLGFIKASIDVARSSDLSLVQEAAKRLQ